MFFPGVIFHRVSLKRLCNKKPDFLGKISLRTSSGIFDVLFPISIPVWIPHSWALIFPAVMSKRGSHSCIKCGGKGSFSFIEQEIFLYHIYNKGLRLILKNLRIFHFMGRKIYSFFGGIPQAIPSTTSFPSWLIQVVLNFARFFSGISSMTSNLAVIVSPILTGARNLTSCER